MSGNVPAPRNSGSEISSATTTKRHREWIAGRVLTLLNHYYREDDPSVMTKALGKDWKDVLEGFPREAIQAACLRYMRTEERKKPTPGVIYRMASEWLADQRTVRLEPMRPETAEERKAREAKRRDEINPERAAEAADIMRGFVGYEEKRQAARRDAADARPAPPEEIAKAREGNHIIAEAQAADAEGFELSDEAAKAAGWTE